MVSWQVKGVEKVYVSQIGLQAPTGSIEVSPLRSVELNLVYTRNGVPTIKTQALEVTGEKGNADPFPPDNSTFSAPLPGSTRAVSLEDLLDHFRRALEMERMFDKELQQDTDSYTFRTSFRKADKLRGYDKGIFAIHEAYVIRIRRTPIRKSVYHFEISVLIQTSRRAQEGEWDDDKDAERNLEEAKKLRSVLVSESAIPPE